MQKIRKAVIPVAGLGTRFLPVTKAVPKEMLPIVDKPTLQYIVEEAVASGIEEILLITSPNKEAIINHFDRSFELEMRLEKSHKYEQLEMVRSISDLVHIYTIRQGEPLGSGHAVSLAESFVGKEPFAVLYGDDLIKGDIPALKELIEVYEKYDANVIGIQEVDPSVVSRYGIISYADRNTGKIASIIEKPKMEEAPSTSAGLGRYIVKPEIFDVLRELKTGANNEYQFTDAMLHLMKTQDFYACPFHGTYYDIGNQLGYVKANIAYALDRKELQEDLKEYMSTILNSQK
ncbi:MAG TPA: UTP--glucose-1-phosphate uridylyltransferase GalU [Candidatus Fimihabitans intestinipullorum]|uniref:UTP--glucose-1-phosphate uridylyltransferase n=1 Tax=Candidatus Fimihabitans intestinipullorum TaxID=2840820 RepID=A0A9D1HVY0_9BACT|nr:UTP--glucose-1-phosphate uridylyltransferase GalU [Candidatus Fimihabitans intestinipullorum]